MRRTEDGSPVTVGTCESTVGRLVSDTASRKGRSTNKEVDPMDSVGENVTLTGIQDVLLTNAKDSQGATCLKTSIHSVFLLPSSAHLTSQSEVPNQPPNPISSLMSQKSQAPQSISINYSEGRAQRGDNKTR